MSSEDCELDPRIQIELENLNTATDEINKLEIELEEANSTFRILLNESTRRLKLSSKKLGNCIEKARPYHDALEKAREAQIECQQAAVKFQRANEIHAAAKETVALAEQRFMSNSHEWQFDNAWQEMLNHATQKVMDAEKQKAESHAEHQRRTKVFHSAETKVQKLEERFRRSITKSRPYFEEKQICQDQLQTQKNRIQELQAQVQSSKTTYATALRNLERISDDIHRQRGDYTSLQISSAPPPGPREPGVGAELNSPTTTTLPPLPDIKMELEKYDYPSVSFAGSQISLDRSSMRSSVGGMHNEVVADAGATIEDSEVESDIGHMCDGDGADADADRDDVFGNSSNAIKEFDRIEALRQKVKLLAVRPIEGGDGQQQQRNDTWEHELNATVNKLDQLMMLNESARRSKGQLHKAKPQQSGVRPDSLGAEAVSQNYDDVVGCPPIITRKMNTTKWGKTKKIASVMASTIAANISSLPTTPEHGNATILTPVKKLQKCEPLPSVNVSMRELPLLARLSHEILDRSTGYSRQRRRSVE